MLLPTNHQPAPPTNPPHPSAIASVTRILGRALTEATHLADQAKTVQRSSDLPQLFDTNLKRGVREVAERFRREYAAAMDGRSATEKEATLASILIDTVLAPGKIPSLGEAIFLATIVGRGHLPSPLNDILAQRAIDAAFATFEEAQSACALLELALQQPDDPVAAEALAARFVTRSLDEKPPREVSIVMCGAQTQFSAWNWRIICRAASSAAITPAIMRFVERELGEGSPDNVHALLVYFGGIHRVQGPEFNALVDRTITVRTQALQTAKRIAPVVEEIAALRGLMALRDWRTEIGGALARNLAEAIGAKFNHWWMTARECGSTKEVRSATAYVVTAAEQILAFCEKHASRDALRKGIGSLLSASPTIRLSTQTMEGLGRIARFANAEPAFKEFALHRMKEERRQKRKLGIPSDVDSYDENKRMSALRDVAHQASLVAPQPLRIVTMSETLGRGPFEIPSHMRRDAVLWFFKHRQSLDKFEQVVMQGEHTPRILVTAIKEIFHNLDECYPEGYGRAPRRLLRKGPSYFDRRLGHAQLAREFRSEAYGGAWGYLNPRVIMETARRLESDHQPSTQPRHAPDHVRTHATILRSHFLRTAGALREALALVAPINDDLIASGTRMGWTGDMACDFERALHEELGSPHLAAARMQQFLECDRLDHEFDLPVRNWIAAARGYLGLPYKNRPPGSVALGNPDLASARKAINLARDQQATTVGDRQVRLATQYPFTNTEIAVLDATASALLTPKGDHTATVAKALDTFSNEASKAPPRAVAQFLRFILLVQDQLIQQERRGAAKDLSIAVSNVMMKAAKTLPHQPKFRVAICRIQFELALSGASAAGQSGDAAAAANLNALAKNYAKGLEVLANDDSLVKRISPETFLNPPAS